MRSSRAVRDWAPAFAGVTLAVLATAAFAATPEREVIWYTAMNTQDAQPLRIRFEERHPGVRLTILRQPGEKIRNRILAEQSAGKDLWDVVSFNHLDMGTLERERLLAAPAKPIYVRQYVIGYNTNLVKPAQAPKDWSDLLAPQWKGKLAMDEDEVEWFAAMLDYYGPDKGARFMRALARQEPQLRRGHTLLAKLLVAGDFPLALVHIQEMEEAKKAGAPVDWVRTLDPIVTSPSAIAIAAKAPHPKAARLLVDFVLSPEGQAILRDRGRMPAIDVAGQGLKIQWVNAALSRDFDRYENEFRETFVKSH